MKWKPIEELNRRESQRVLVAQSGRVAILSWYSVRQMWVDDSGRDVLPLDELGQPTHFAIVPNAPA